MEIIKHGCLIIHRYEERLRRGKRQHVPFNRHSDSDDDEEYEVTQPRKLKTKGGKTVPEKNLYLADIVSSVPLCPDNFGLNNYTSCNVLKKNSFVSHSNGTSSQQATSVASCSYDNSSQQDTSCTSRFHKSSSQEGMENLLSREKEKSNSVVLKGRGNLQLDNCSVLFDDYVPHVPEDNVSHVPKDYVPEDFITYVPEDKENWSLKKYLVAIGRMQAKANVKLEDMKERLKKIENVLRNNALNPVENKDVYITPLYFYFLIQ